MGPRTDEALPRSIQLLHLDQAFVKDIIRNLTYRHVFTVGDDKRISCYQGVNETNYSM